MSRKMEKQAIALVGMLSASPGMSIDEITDRLETEFGDTYSYPHHIIAYVRNRVGDEVLVTEYNHANSRWEYRLSVSAEESQRYVVQRKTKVRKEAANLVGILDRIEAKWPGQADVKMARVYLNSVVEILDLTS